MYLGRTCRREQSKLVLNLSGNQRIYGVQGRVPTGNTALADYSLEGMVRNWTPCLDSLLA